MLRDDTTVLRSIAADESLLTREEARALTDEAKVDELASSIRKLRLYRGGAHTALGHESWGD